MERRGLLPADLRSAHPLGLACQGRGRLMCPVLLCEVCGSPINDAQLAWAYFRTGLSSGEVTAVAVVHKGPCLDLYENIGGRDLGTAELETFLIQLLANSGIDPQAVPAIDHRIRQNEF